MGRHTRTAVAASVFSSATLLLFGAGAAQAHPTGGATTIEATAPGQPIPNYYPPVPPGFDPLTATDAELQHYGFPLPPPASHPAALASWRQAMADAHTEVASTAATSSETATNMLTVSSSAPLTNWAGWISIGSNNNNVVYTETSANFTVPNVSGSSSYTSGAYQSAPGLLLWTGMGGATGTSTERSVDQAGVAAIQTSTPQYRFWYEDYPYFSMVYHGPGIKAGQTAYVNVSFSSSSYVTTYYLENLTTGDYQPFAVRTPDWASTPYLSSADYVMEPKAKGLVTHFGSASYTACLSIASGTLDSLGSSNDTEEQSPGISVGPIEGNGFTVSG